MKVSKGRVITILEVEVHTKRITLRGNIIAKEDQVQEEKEEIENVTIVVLRDILEEIAKKRIQDDKNQKPQEVVDAAIVSEEFDFGDVLNVGTEKKITSWIMDSGCTFHMCPNREWFQNFKECKGGWFFLEITGLVRFLV